MDVPGILFELGLVRDSVLGKECLYSLPIDFILTKDIVFGLENFRFQ